MKLTGKHCVCYRCGEYFNSASTFDGHRVGDWRERGTHRRCLTVAEMTALGWLKNAGDYWIRERMQLRPVFASTSRQNSRSNRNPLPDKGVESAPLDGPDVQEFAA